MDGKYIVNTEEFGRNRSFEVVDLSHPRSPHREDQTHEVVMQPNRDVFQAGWKIVEAIREGIKERQRFLDSIHQLFNNVSAKNDPNDSSRRFIAFLVGGAITFAIQDVVNGERVNIDVSRLKPKCDSRTETLVDFITAQRGPNAIGAATLETKDWLRLLVTNKKKVVRSFFVAMAAAPHQPDQIAHAIQGGFVSRLRRRLLPTLDKAKPAFQLYECFLYFIRSFGSEIQSSGFIDREESREALDRYVQGLAEYEGPNPPLPTNDVAMKIALGIHLKVTSWSTSDLTRIMGLSNITASGHIEAHALQIATLNSQVAALNAQVATLTAERQNASVSHQILGPASEHNNIQPQPPITHTLREYRRMQGPLEKKGNIQPLHTHPPRPHTLRAYRRMQEEQCEL